MLHLIPLTDDSWAKFWALPHSWLEVEVPRALPREAILVGDDGELIAGAVIYNSSGPYVIVIGLNSDLISPDLADRAFRQISQAVVGVCATKGKFPLVFTSPESVAGEVFVENGFVPSPVPCLVYAGKPVPKPPKPKKKKKASARRKKK